MHLPKFSSMCPLPNPKQCENPPFIIRTVPLRWSAHSSLSFFLCIPNPSCESISNILSLILVQHECIPQAILGMDIVCQAKSGMGKTAVFVLATLQQLEPVDGQVGVIVLCHTRELAFQICKEYER